MMGIDSRTGRIACAALAAMAMSLMVRAQRPSFAVGADISWVTEMEADGKKFYNSKGVETDLFQLMKDQGMNSIRLRVWVGPESAYGPWCNKADVVLKAKRAAELGMAVMIDFHYSDFFADPSRQTTPVSWSECSFANLKTAVGDHTRDVLETLKNEGIEPAWVQVGNETRQGMLWPSGQLTWGSNINAEWRNYAALSNAGYDAVKLVFPNTPVIVHLNNAMDDNLWWFQAFKTGGGKLDMVGLSHYPSKDDYTSENSKAITNIKKLSNNLRLPILLVEVGTPSSNATTAYTMMNDLYTKLKSQNIIKGMFYWEPEVYGYWKPSYYSTLGWNSYDRGAFTSAGRPDRVLTVFSQAAEDYAEANGVRLPDDQTMPVKDGLYDLQGRKVCAGTETAMRDMKLPSGIYIQGGHKVVKR